MSGAAGEQVKAREIDVLGEAAAELVARGFERREDGAWCGALDCRDHGPVPATVRLPDEFPGALPEVFVERSSLARRVPHVERSGKACIGPTSGVLLDPDNPRGIVREAIGRAEDVLAKGLSGENDADFITEFLAYWDDGADGIAWSVCNPSGQSRRIRQVLLGRAHRDGEMALLLADSSLQAQAWASKIGRRIESQSDAFFVQLLSAFTPPDFEEKLSNADVMELVRAHASPQTERELKAWLSRQRLPVTIMLSLPLASPDAGRIVTAVRLAQAEGDLARRAQRGFRAGRAPADLEMRYARDVRASKLRVERFDEGYLLTRGGAAAPLYSKTVVVIGCGAVGSHVAERLASLGVGRLRIIDPEVLTAENVYRHALGVGYVGMNKAAGMKAELGRRLPHVQIEVREEGVEEVLKKSHDFITGADLMIVALGDESLEMRLNDVLGSSTPRLHVWVEPLGVGGHVLATGVAGGGCYRCLFEVAASRGIFNRAAFAEPGQNFQKTFSGCAGMFTPFAEIDADRAAVEAARVAASVLLKEVPENLLISWRGTSGDFESAGFSLSARGEAFNKGEQRRERRFVRPDCPSCGKADA